MTARRRAGRLIVLEGIDGSGKSTLQRRLARRFRAEGWRVAVAREPNDRTLGRRAQSAAVSDPWGSAVLFTLDRWAARSRLKSLLAEFDLVLMDRSFYSTLAYQGSSLSEPDRLSLVRLQRTATIPPDRVLLLDVPVAVALKRIGGRGERRAPLERRARLERVARAYREMARPPRWLVLDARRPTPETAEDAALRLRRWLGPPPEGRPPRT